MVESSKIAYVVFAFFAALFLGALKGFVIGPVASVILIIGNVTIILGLFPAHVLWTVSAVIKSNKFSTILKVFILFSLVPLFALWLGLGIFGSLLVGIGYGFFTPWVSTFEAFRHTDESKKLMHCVTDGTWGTIKGSCTVVRDFLDVCFVSYSCYLKEICEWNGGEIHNIRLLEIPACIIVAILGLLVEVLFFTLISVVKSPYMLFKGWQRLLHDLVSREGPFLETACVPIAGFVILLWPLFVVGSILLAVFTSIFVGLYGSVIVYQERSFTKGLAYVIAMVAEFDEYTNDSLYLREGSCLPKPRYRKINPNSEEFFEGGSPPSSVGCFCFKNKQVNLTAQNEVHGILVPNLSPTRSVMASIQEVKMVQIWEDMMKACEWRGLELVDADAITIADLEEWCTIDSSSQAVIIGLGLPSYALLQSLLYSIKADICGLLLSGGVEVTHHNGPQDKLFHWFFHPLVVLRDQIKAMQMIDSEIKYLEKYTLFGGNKQRIESWDNGAVTPSNILRCAQIQGISRRLQGMTRGISKFPTYRRRYTHVVRALILYIQKREERSETTSISSIELCG